MTFRKTGDLPDSHHCHRVKTHDPFRGKLQHGLKKSNNQNKVVKRNGDHVVKLGKEKKG